MIRRFLCLLLTALALACLPLLSVPAEGREEFTVTLSVSEWACTAADLCAVGDVNGVQARTYFRFATSFRYSDRRWDLAELAKLDSFRLEEVWLNVLSTASKGSPTLQLHALTEDWSADGIKSGIWPLPEKRALTADAFRRGWRQIRITAQFARQLSENTLYGFLLMAPNAESGARNKLDASAFNLSVTFSMETGENPGLKRESVQHSGLLDSALSMIEEGNCFLDSYCDLASSLTEAIYPLGVPYMFGGKKADMLLEPHHPLAESRNYKSAYRYLYGFDCSGYLDWVLRENRYAVPEDYSTLLTDDGLAIDPSDPFRWQRRLQAGDALLVFHGTRHMLIYMGTLRDFGFENEPGLEGLGDAPVFIHCGINPFYTDRYKAYIRRNNLRLVLPPDGGVTVSIVLPSAENVPNRRVENRYAFSWYELGDTVLGVFPLDDCSRTVVWRPWR